MKSIIKHIGVEEIKKCNKQDFLDAFNYFNKNNGEIEELSTNTKNIILGIIELSNKFNLNKSDPSLKYKIIDSLCLSDKLEYIGIGTIISKIIYGDGEINKIVKDEYNDFYLKLLQTDKKTGLPNEEQLRSDINECNGNKMVVILKINHFNHINSYLGYESGEEILLEIKNKLKNDFKKIGFKIYKTSQLNFGLFREEIPSNKLDSKEIIDQIRRITDNLVIDSKFGKLNIKTTLGIACKQHASFENALNALYSSADSGKIITYSKDIDKKVVQESKNIVEWSKKIKEGLEKNYFIPYYQGIRNNNTGEIGNYEALIRYNNGTDITSPGEFLEIAKEINLIGEISKKLVEIVISEMREHNFNISINLTEEDFSSDNLINIIMNNLDFYQISPDRLTVEILEDITGVLDDNIIKNIKKLQSLGIKISIDDFGTGHSNFARLTQINPDYLKIDGSLVKGIISKSPEEAKNNSDILRSVVEYGHLHNAKIIAEYVENEEIQNTLNLLGIDFSQGYLYSKPNRNNIKK